MKFSYKDMPDGMKGTFGDFSRNFGFSWKEFVVTVPSPLFLVTTYKDNGQPNACMQSWATFTSADHVMLCLEVIGLHVDEDHLPDRTGENGILYNIHYQINPENVGKTAHDYAAVLQKKIDVAEY